MMLEIAEIGLRALAITFGVALGSGLALIVFVKVAARLFPRDPGR